MPEEHRRLLYRNKMRVLNQQLADAAHQAGVLTDKHYADFQNKGYMGLYGDLTEDAIHARKGLLPTQHILDHMTADELLTNEFRAMQTRQKLERERIKDRKTANAAHFLVGRKIRQTIIELGGTLPEEMPTPTESIQQLEARQEQREVAYTQAKRLTGKSVNPVDYETVFDGPFSYRVGQHRPEALCHLKLLRHRSGHLVVLTELDDNPGLPVATAIEHLATQIAHQFALNEQLTTWVEQVLPQAKRGPQSIERYDRVEFTWDPPYERRDYAQAFDPRWRRLKPQEVAVLFPKTAEVATALARHHQQIDESAAEGSAEREEKPPF